MSGRRRLTDDEIRTWKQVTRDVSPLHKDLLPSDSVAQRFENADARRVQFLQAPTPILRAGQTQGEQDLFFAGDPKQERRVRRGKTPITATLDLHGLTQERAFTALASFLEQSRGGGHRHVLVITGRGKLPDGGVLRRSFGHWVHLPALAQHIIRVSNAAPSHGGDGAFYVFLKRG